MARHVEDLEKGYRISVSDQHWKVTIEQIDTMGGTFQELYEIVKCTLRGSGFTDEMMKEYFDE